MTKSDVVKFRLTPEDRRTLECVARHYGVGKSKAIRMLIDWAARTIATSPHVRAT